MSQIAKSSWFGGPWGTFAGLLAVLACAWLLSATPWLTGLEDKLMDRQFMWLRALGPLPLAQDVVLVGIDEQSSQVLDAPFSLWHPYYGRFFQAMAEAKPAVVGVDLIFQKKDYSRWLGDDLKIFWHGLLALRKEHLLVVARTLQKDGHIRPIERKTLLLAGGDQATGFALFEADADERVRRFGSQIARQGQSFPTLVGRMAERMGISPDQGWIQFAAGPPFSYIPFYQVLASQQAKDVEALRQAFAGKPVILGVVWQYEDREYLPVELAGWEPDKRYLSGLLLHAQALRSLLGPGLVHVVPFWAVPALALLGSLFWLRGRHMVKDILLLLFWCLGLVLGSTWLLANGWKLPIAAPLLCAVFGFGLRYALLASAQIRERRCLTNLLGGYVSPQILKAIQKGQLEAGLNGSRQNICVLFSDIRGFTERSEGMPPELVIALLNQFFEHMTEAIHHYGGTIDKFMGDGIMAFFGAPQALDRPCDNAFLAVQSMQEHLRQLNQSLQQTGEAKVEIGIALHLGDAVVGNIGAKQRYNYTAIGDVVNVSSRLEGLTKQLGYPVICSQEVVSRLTREHAFNDLGRQAIKGHSPVHIFGWPEAN